MNPIIAAFQAARPSRRGEHRAQDANRRPSQRRRVARRERSEGSEAVGELPAVSFRNMHAYSAEGFSDEAIEDNGPEAQAEEKERYEPQMSRNRELEIEHLGVPGCRSKCFGCVYIGETKCAAIPQADLRKLIEMARKSLGQTDLLVLCKSMADFYARFRAKVNRTRIRGRKKLPKWPAAMIMDHFRNHTHDPEIKQLVQMCDIQELLDETHKACLEKSNKTGKVRANKDQVAVYERLTKLYWTVSKVDPSKMAFYSAGARMDPSTMRQGVISSGTKNLIDYWRETASEF